MSYTKRKLSALHGNVVRHRLEYGEEEELVDIEETMESCKPEVTNIIQEESDRFFGNVKWFLVLNVILTKLLVLPEVENEEIRTTVNFHSYSYIGMNVRENLDELYDNYALAIRKILASFDSFVRYGSGWVIGKIHSLDINIVRYNPLYTSSSSYVETPDFIARKKAVINIRNPHDEKCLLWSILAYFHYRRTRMTVEYLSRFAHEINTQGVNFPSTVRDLRKIEALNPNISVNVIAYDSDKGKFFPYRCSTHRNRRHQVNLLLLTSKTFPQKSHFCLINTPNGKS